MKLTKTKMQKIQKKYRLFVFWINLLVFIIFFFNAVLLLHGSWSDIHMQVVIALPALTLVSLGASMINVSKYNSEGRELVASIVMLVCSSLLGFLVMIYPVIVS